MLDQSGSPDLHLYTFSILDHQNIMNNTFILKVHRHCIFLFFIFGLYYGFFFFFSLSIKLEPLLWFGNFSSMNERT